MLISVVASCRVARLQLVRVTSPLVRTAAAFMGLCRAMLPVLAAVLVLPASHACLCLCALTDGCCIHHARLLHVHGMHVVADCAAAAWCAESAVQQGVGPICVAAVSSR